MTADRLERAVRSVTEPTTEAGRALLDELTRAVAGNYAGGTVEPMQDYLAEGIATARRIVEVRVPAIEQQAVAIGVAEGIRTTAQASEQWDKEALVAYLASPEAERALVERVEPKRHGQLCPVWIKRNYPRRVRPTWTDCDCWQRPNARDILAALREGLGKQ